VKSSTYASLVTIVFINHKDKVSKSIESVIRTTDRLAKEIGLKNDLSHMTKYRIISQLINSNILENSKTKKNIKLSLSKRISNALINR
jgi:hypothetical protein